MLLYYVRDSAAQRGAHCDWSTIVYRWSGGHSFHLIKPLNMSSLKASLTPPKQIFWPWLWVQNKSTAFAYLDCLFYALFVRYSFVAGRAITFHSNYSVHTHSELFNLITFGLFDLCHWFGMRICKLIVHVSGLISIFKLLFSSAPHFGYANTKNSR